jgi:uncharacterized protein
MPDAPTRRLTRALLVLTAWTAGAFVMGALSRSDPVSNAAEIVTALASGLALNLVAALAVLALATWRFRWGDLGFRAPDWGGLVRVMGFPLLTLAPLPLLAWGIGFPPGLAVAYLALNTALIALSEEWMFRGILLRALLARFRLWPAVLITSVLFGAFHVLNAFTLGDLRMALAQSVAAMMTGMLLVALVLRTGSIWPAVAYHMVWNFGLLLVAHETLEHLPLNTAPPLSAYLMPMVIVSPNLFFALFLLRKVGNADGRPVGNS